MTPFSLCLGLSLSHTHVHTHIIYYIKLGNKKHFIALKPFGTLPGSLSNDYSYS